MTQEQNISPPLSRDKVIERLKKLFAMSKSENQHEAEAALAKANAIMTEYQIGVADVDLSQESSITQDELELDGGRASTWIVILASASARLYDAQAFYANSKGPNLILRFFGTPTDIAAAQMTFTHLHQSWKSIVAADKRLHPGADTRRFRRSHGIGFSHAIKTRVGRLVEERKAAVSSATGRDLVVLKSAAVDEFVSKKANVKQQSMSRPDVDAFRRGYERGKTIPLDGAIETDETTLIGSGVAA